MVPNEKHIKKVFSLAHSIQQEFEATGFQCRPKKKSVSDLYDALITEVELIAVTKRLFFDGHFPQAVEEAYKLLNNVVKNKSGLRIDGSSLMKTVFSPNNPVLKLSTLKTQSQKDQQLGYMEIMSGCMTGIRNPRAHEHSYADVPLVALELIVWANHLMRLTKQTKKTRKKKKGKP